MGSVQVRYSCFVPLTFWYVWQNFSMFPVVLHACHPLLFPVFPLFCPVRIVKRWKTVRLGACSVSQHRDKSLPTGNAGLTTNFSKYLPAAVVNLSGTVQILL